MNSMVDILDDSSESSLELPLSPTQQHLVNQLTEQRTKVSSQPPPSSATSIDSQHTIDVKANYVNLLLTAYGYPVPLIFNSTDKSDVVKVLDCFQLVLQDIRKHQEERDDMNETIIRLQQEQEQLQNNLDRCVGELDKKEQEIAKAKIKAKSADEELKRTIEGNRHAKEEASKAKNNMQYMKSQYAHETRRLELEHAKTRERLTKLMKEKLKTNVIAMTVNNPSTIPDMDLESDTSALQDMRAMDKDLLRKSSDRERQAREESEELRIALIKMYTAVRRLLETQIETFDAQKSRKETMLNIEKYKLPMNFGASEGMEQVAILLDRLQEEWNRQIADRSIYTKEDMEEKDQRIQQWQSQVTELEELLERLEQEQEQKEQIHLRFASSGFFDDLAKESHLELSDSEDSVLEDEATKTSQYQQLRLKARKDQEKITEAAISLGNERTKLEAERWAFEEVKRQTKLQEIMESFLSTTSHSKKRRTSQFADN